MHVAKTFICDYAKFIIHALNYLKKYKDIFRKNMFS